MRAVVCDEYGPFENLTVKPLPDPIAGPGDVVIDVKAAGVSFAQSLTVAGKYQVKPDLPFVPGVEVGGIVSDLGDGVSGLAVGTRVFAGITYGGFAERALARAVYCRPLPDGMDFAQGTLMVTSYPTAYAALIWKADLSPGETVLVHGASGAVGLAAVEIAKAKGADVIATAGSDEKCAVALDHGADMAINYSVEDFLAPVKERTAGRGVDVVIDPVGGETLTRSLRAMGREARLVTVGYASGDIPSPPVNLLLVKNMSIIGLNFGTYMGWSPGDDGSAYLGRLDELHADLRRMFAEGRIKPVVSHRFQLDDFNPAMQTVLGRRSVGKVVLEP